jgi:hypothetical protein
MTEKERLSLYRQSERYRAYQERMQAWEAERKRQQAAAAYQRVPAGGVGRLLAGRSPVE